MAGRSGGLPSFGAAPSEHVHIDNLFALLGIGLLNGLLHIFDGILHWNHVGELKESGLQDHIGVVAQAQFSGQLRRIHNVEIHVVVSDVPLHIAGKLFGQFLFRPGGVQQEGPAVLDLVNHGYHEKHPVG